MVLTHGGSCGCKTACNRTVFFADIRILFELFDFCDLHSAEWIGLSFRLVTRFVVASWTLGFRRHI